MSWFIRPIPILIMREGTLYSLNELRAGSTRPFFIKVPHRKEGALTTDKQLLVRDTVAMLTSISHLTRLARGVILTIDVTRQFVSK